MGTKRVALVAVLLVVVIVSLVTSGCSISMQGRQGGGTSEVINVESTCPEATSVGDGSCNVEVIKLGNHRGN